MTSRSPWLAVAEASWERPPGRLPWGVGLALSCSLLLGMAAASPLPRPSTALGSSSMPGVALSQSLAPCQLTATRRVQPVRLALEQEATIHLEMAAACEPNATPLHLVLVIDASLDHMGDQQLESLLTSLRAAISQLHISQLGYLKVGVVLVADGDARVASFLTSSEAQLLAALRVQAASGSACLSCGLAEALRVLRHGRGSGPVREAIFLATLGIGPASCQVVREGADALKAYGALVVTACAGRTCSWPCLTEAASSARFAFRSWEWTYVDERIFELVTSTGPTFHPIQNVQLEDLLSDNLDYVGGGYPHSVIGNQLRWQFSPWPTEGISLTYRVRSLSCGRYAVSQEAPRAVVTFNTTFWSGIGPSSMTLPNPVVEVNCPVPTSTAETPASTATVAIATAVPSREPTTGTPTADRSAEPRHVRRYLPSLLVRGCPDAAAPLDVALMVDVSGSMMEPAPGLQFPTRLAAASAIGLAMLDELRAETDRVAVIVYGDETMLQVLAPLGPCCPAARQALLSLPKYNGSRLDLAMATAMAELVRFGRPQAGKLILGLTDGDLNQTPVEQLLRVTDAARQAGIGLQLVILGEPSDLGVLERAASPERVHLVPRLGVADPRPLLATLARCGR